MHTPLLSRSRATALVKVCLLLSVNLSAANHYLLSAGQYVLGSSTYAFVKRDDDDDDDDDELSGAKFWVFMGISITLVLLGGIFAGLTLGLMGQDEVYLQVVQQTGNATERKNASKVLSLLKRGKHWVLVTMLLSNVITNETLPIVLDRCLGGGWPAVVSSTILIVIFGEVIPQSVSVRYGLAIGAAFTPFVLFLMYAMCPIAYPTALLLDHVLGEDHGTVYRKAQLKTLVTLHRSMGTERLNRDEVTIISSVLDLNEKPIGVIMTPIQDVYTMSADRILDEAAVEEILRAGFSRIPIHTPDEPHNFIGMLLVRILISYDPEDALPVSSFPLATLPETRPDTTCLSVLNYFQEGKSHMMLVSDSPGEAYGALGVVTLEDVIEELIGEEIVDESDVYVDISQGIRRKHASPLTQRSLSTQLAVQLQRNTPSPDVKIEPSTGATSSLLPTAAVRQRESIVRGAGLPKTASAATGALPKMEPLNLAIRPKQTTIANVTIKKDAMENYVRRASLDNQGGSYAGRSGSVPPNKISTIDEQETHGLLSNEEENRPGISRLATGGSVRSERRSSVIELDSLARRTAGDGTGSGSGSSDGSNGNGVISPAASDANSMTRLLSEDAGYDADMHFSGLHESVREVHGYKKTIVEVLHPNAIESDEGSDDEGSADSGSGRKQIGDLERGPSPSGSTASVKQKRDELERHGSMVGGGSSGGNGTSSKPSDKPASRKGSFFSDHRFHF
ncbi:uncharacterized protein V1516DRAFT_673487 [Lipomyces oligophaga]|uniref:uncharacterized protein n=1 Tax=Lipomyces oligophaga TaxID=45792 RepID=UPI0034CE7A2C